MVVKKREPIPTKVLSRKIRGKIRWKCAYEFLVHTKTMSHVQIGIRKNGDTLASLEYNNMMYLLGVKYDVFVRREKMNNQSRIQTHPTGLIILDLWIMNRKDGIDSNAWALIYGEDLIGIFRNWSEVEDEATRMAILMPPSPDVRPKQKVTRYDLEELAPISKALRERLLLDRDRLR